MRRITRKVRRKRKQIIVISSICLLLCLCVGYAAFGTQLSIRAKGNIKEKPHCMLGDIKVNTVTEGDGLYEDIYEEGKSTYKGANPNNYIMFNEELWRIIAKETDGTYKIIKDEISNNKIAWDTSNSNIWTRPATLNTYLNGEYYNSLTALAKSQIISHSWNIGPVASFNNNLVGQIELEQSEKWNGNVGGLAVSEYIRANTNKEECGTLYLINNNASICNNTNWLIGKTYWFISYIAVDHFVWFLDGGSHSGIAGASSTYPFRPVVFLKTDITLSGKGTEQNPYVIIN